MKCYYELAYIQYHKLGNKTTLSVIGFAYIIYAVIPIAILFSYVKYGIRTMSLEILLFMWTCLTLNDIIKKIAER